MLSASKEKFQVTAKAHTENILTSKLREQQKGIRGRALRQTTTHSKNKEKYINAKSRC
jgi:hypothetical protein